LFERLRAGGVACCIPEAAPLEERVIEIEGLVSAALALRDTPVASAADFGPAGRIAILTGPNSGGKTTYLRSVGLAVALFQAGLMVPGQRARISPVDAIYTHFPTLESRFHGRLADEALRLREILRAATRHSLVLLNETFSSTAAAEAVYLAQELLAALRAIGARVVYATHLSELAGQMEEIEKLADGDCRLFSLVAGVVVNEAGESAPTYQIMRGLPHGRSYARDIARKHGISLEQILAERT
jgi:DNA mismatch repair ATPase MutS